jgi:hypothetical protein
VGENPSADVIAGERGDAQFRRRPPVRADALAHGATARLHGVIVYRHRRGQLEEGSRICGGIVGERKDAGESAREPLIAAGWYCLVWQPGGIGDPCECVRQTVRGEEERCGDGASGGAHSEVDVGQFHARFVCTV